LIAVFVLSLTAGSLLHAAPSGTTMVKDAGAAGSGMAAKQFPSDFRLDRETTVLTRPDLSSPTQSVLPMQSGHLMPPNLRNFPPILAEMAQTVRLRQTALRI